MKRKYISTITAALRECGLKDGMTLSFHHHLRNGDHVVNMTMDAVAALGVKDITVACSSLFPVHEHLIEHIKTGVITGLDTDYMSGPLAKAVTGGILPTPVIFRSHGGRPRAIGEGSLKIDIAVVAAPAVDAMGNITGTEGPSACGSLGYIIPDTQHAAKVIAVTDHVVEGGLGRISIPHDVVDHVVVVDKIGDPAGIVSGSISLTRDPVALAIARNAQAVIKASGLLQDGFCYQTGAGGASLAASLFLREDMRAMKVHGGFLLGGITKYMVEMLEEGLFDNVFDVQCFDLSSVKSIAQNPRHVEISADTYANPNRKSNCVDFLDAVLLGGTEIDLDFNVNVTTDSNGNIIGGSGGHNDAAAGAKLTIIVAPLVRARLPIVVEKCTTLTTIGSTVDVLVTERGIAVNPARKELADRLRDARLPVCGIEDLHDQAVRMTGKPLAYERGDKVVGTMEYRDGTIVDHIYATKQRT
ncbi:citrate lyase subunit alpha [Desulfovibrio sp. 86]|uniref:Citrate lyase alpha chain n=1 Tax=uncultured Desulfovibrio sp. TaxID=167968 RepID=A0A212L0I3_9BACT|nr:citrate lyase subunit alpha [Desulfovibrio sp. 86]SCM71091.1 citrate lyase, citrate-ACP transferase (alpha) subunit [uncultured Desulfovibrio sp.]VZH32732.1 Citrate lyase alpha chain [Desulfovibrio sp. 86]